jgi:hypothetical protein
MREGTERLFDGKGQPLQSRALRHGGAQPCLIIRDAPRVRQPGRVLAAEPVDRRFGDLRASIGGSRRAGLTGGVGSGSLIFPDLGEPHPLEGSTTGQSRPHHPRGLTNPKNIALETEAPTTILEGDSDVHIVLTQHAAPASKAVTRGADGERHRSGRRPALTAASPYTRDPSPSTAPKCRAVSMKTVMTPPPRRPRASRGQRRRQRGSRWRARAGHRSARSALACLTSVER